MYKFLNGIRSFPLLYMLLLKYAPIMEIVETKCVRLFICRYFSHARLMCFLQICSAKRTVKAVCLFVRSRTCMYVSVGLSGSFNRKALIGVTKFDGCNVHIGRYVVLSNSKWVIGIQRCQKTSAHFSLVGVSFNCRRFTERRISHERFMRKIGLIEKTKTLLCIFFAGNLGNLLDG